VADGVESLGEVEGYEYNDIWVGLEQAGDGVEKQTVTEIAQQQPALIALLLRRLLCIFTLVLFFDENSQHNCRITWLYFKVGLRETRQQAVLPSSAPHDSFR